jgi:serine/threonine-protein kinase
VLDAARLPGSRRFMAPEEWQHGATIDQVTNVFTLGRTALVLLGDGTDTREAWRGNAAMHALAVRATAPERNRRYPDIHAFVAAWRAACSGQPCAS